MRSGVVAREQRITSRATTSLLSTDAGALTDLSAGAERAYVMRGEWNRKVQMPGDAGPRTSQPLVGDAR